MGVGLGDYARFVDGAMLDTWQSSPLVQFRLILFGCCFEFVDFSLQKLLWADVFEGLIVLLEQSI